MANEKPGTGAPAPTASTAATAAASMSGSGGTVAASSGQAGADAIMGVAKLAEQGTADVHSVTEFCSRLSTNLKAPELIGAFHAAEIAAGKIRDTAENFKQRFEAFCGAKPKR